MTSSFEKIDKFLLYYGAYQTTWRLFQYEKPLGYCKLQPDVLRKRQNVVYDVTLHIPKLFITPNCITFKTQNGSHQWQIYIVNYLDARPPPLVGPIFFIFMQYSKKKCWQNNRLAAPGNPGSVAANWGEIERLWLWSN